MTLPGSDLRDRIAALLRIQHNRVDVEVRVGATTADVLYIDESHPAFPQTIAIEAKDWKKPLTSVQIAEIHSNYNVALASGEIDKIWIIGNHVLHGSPNETVRRTKGLAYTTYSQFQAGLINFSPLIQHNMDIFSSDPASKNFISSRTSDGSDLLKKVREWIGGAKPGLVVQGGYGLGKTTFSKFLASKLSQEYKDGSFDRIPIRISLGELFYKQDVNALISSSLAGADSGARISNFNFSMFLEMNRLGKILLIFDGFDEMRHAIDLEDFVFNFTQMRTLLTGSAKLMLLGRPDAFISDTEETKVLSALFDKPGSASSGLDQVHLGFFEQNDVETYLENFLNDRELDETKRSKIFGVATSIFSNDTHNILSRPVQLSMFTQVIDDFVDDESTSLTRYSLYEIFIYKFIVREHRKPARKLASPADYPIGQDPRAKFMQSVAWWIIHSKRDNRFTLSELANAQSSLDVAAGSQSETALKDKLLGSVIEPMDSTGVLGKKGQRYYYFPHKSYIEFLVAQYFSYENFTPKIYRQFINQINPEIVSFLVEGPEGGLQKLRQGLDSSTGVVPRYIVEAASKDQSISAEVNRNSNLGPMDVYTYYMHQRFLGSADSFIQKQLARTGTSSRLLALINCAGDTLKAHGNRALARLLIVNFLTSVFDLHRIQDFVQSQRPLGVIRDEESSVKAAALLNAVEVSSAGVHLYPDRLIDFVLSSGGATTKVELWGQGDYREILLSMEELDLPPGPSIVAVLSDDISGSERRSIPVQLMGNAETLYGNARSQRLS